MSLDSKSFFALLMCSVVAIIAGCDAGVKEKVTEEDSVTEANVDSESAASDSGASDTTASDTKASDAMPTGGFEVAVAEGGALMFNAPDAWKKVKPRSFVVEYEIAVPKSEGEADDAQDGRLTIMGAGGSVQANVDRWYGQYSQPDGGATKDVAKVTETNVGECKVTWVDITGTLMDKPGGPMSGGATVERENYRTLAAIIQAGEHGQYFVKLYGPGKTIADNEAAFKGFVESLKVNDQAKGM